MQQIHHHKYVQDFKNTRIRYDRKCKKSKPLECKKSKPLECKYNQDCFPIIVYHVKMVMITLIAITILVYLI